MDEQQLREEPELAESVVGGHGSLGALMSEQTATDIRLLNHGDVVRAIADGQRHRVPTFLYLYDSSCQGVQIT